MVFSWPSVSCFLYNPLHTPPLIHTKNITMQSLYTKITSLFPSHNKPRPSRPYPRPLSPNIDLSDQGTANNITTPPPEILNSPYEEVLDSLGMTPLTPYQASKASPAAEAAYRHAMRAEYDWAQQQSGRRWRRRAHFRCTRVRNLLGRIREWREGGRGERRGRRLHRPKGVVFVMVGGDE